MFEAIKRAAALRAARASFDSTLKAVRASPRANQREIAGPVSRELDAAIGAVTRGDRKSLAHFYQHSRQQRQLFAQVSDHEAEPRWAVCALLESWSYAALTDEPLFYHVHESLLAWVGDVGSSGAPPAPPPAQPAAAVPATASPPALAAPAATASAVPLRVPKMFRCDVCGSVKDIGPGFHCERHRCPAP